MPKRILIPLTIILLFLLSACGTSPMSKEEVSQMEESEETSQKEDSDLNEAKNHGLIVSSEKEIQSTDSVDIHGDTNNNSGDSDSESKESAVKQEENDNQSTSVDETNSDTLSKDESKGNDSLTSSKNETEEIKEKSNGNSSTKTENESTQQSEEEKKKEPAESSKKKKSESEQSSEQDKNKNKNKDENSNTESDSDTKQEEKPNNTIVQSIVISDSEVPLKPTEMDIENDDTVLDALIKITQKNRIQMDFRGGQGSTAYVEGMGNVYEFDRGPGSGWMFRVNGIFPDRGAGVIKLKDGDRVEWLYTTDLGEDIGADLESFR